MIRVLGNSPERILIKDLDDIIYYKQIKEYTDQEYETSRDLKKAINNGKLAILEQNKPYRGSAETDGTGNRNFQNIQDLKTALREILPEFNNNVSHETIKGAVREIAPLIVEMIRQEISKINVSTISVPKKKNFQFIGPEYIPDINTDKLKGNIRAEERASTEKLDDSLAALRALKKKK